MRVDTDDFGRPCRCGREHHIEVKEIIIESGAVKKLEEAMSDGFLKEYISPLLICDTNTMEATEEVMEDIYDRCQVLTLDAENLHADEHAVEIVENYMDEDIDLILAVGSGTIHDISRYLAFQYKVPFVSVPTAASVDGFVSVSYTHLEINQADYHMLLRVPGIGEKSARRIVGARKYHSLDYPDLKKIGVVLKRAVYFITCSGRQMYPVPLDEDYIVRNLVKPQTETVFGDSKVTYRQLSLFDDHMVLPGMKGEISYGV